MGWEFFVLSESRSPVACTLHEVEIHRLWLAIVSGQSAPWMTSRWMGGSAGANRPGVRPGFRARGLESLKKAIAEGIAFWIAKQDAGCGPRPWLVADPGFGIFPETANDPGFGVGLKLGPEALELLSGLVQGKFPRLFKKAEPDSPPLDTLGNQLFAWIIGDWAIFHAPVIMETLIRNVSPETALLWAACNPRLLGLLPSGPQEGFGAAMPQDNVLPEKHSLQFMGTPGVMELSLIPLLEGALATRLHRAWKIHHKALKEATSLPRIQERARWARQTSVVWEALLQDERASFWLPRVLSWVGEILEPMEGLTDAFAKEIDWKGASLAERQALRRDAFLALRIGSVITQKYEESLRVGYLDEAYDDAQGYLRRFRNSGGAPWGGLVASLLRELSPTEAPAAISNNEPISGEQS